MLEIDYLTEILDLTPTAANVDHYIKIVESIICKIKTRYGRIMRT